MCHNQGNRDQRYEECLNRTKLFSLAEPPPPSPPPLHGLITAFSWFLMTNVTRVDDLWCPILPQGKMALYIYYDIFVSVKCFSINLLNWMWCCRQSWLYWFLKVKKMQYLLSHNETVSVIKGSTVDSDAHHNTESYEEELNHHISWLTQPLLTVSSFWKLHECTEAQQQMSAAQSHSRLQEDNHNFTSWKQMQE